MFGTRVRHPLYVPALYSILALSSALKGVYLNKNKHPPPRQNRQILITVLRTICYALCSFFYRDVQILYYAGYPHQALTAIGTVFRYSVPPPPGSPSPFSHFEYFTTHYALHCSFSIFSYDYSHLTRLYLVKIYPTNYLNKLLIQTNTSFLTPSTIPDYYPVFFSPIFCSFLPHLPNAIFPIIINIMLPTYPQLSIHLLPS